MLAAQQLPACLALVPCTPHTARAASCSFLYEAALCAAGSAAARAPAAVRVLQPLPWGCHPALLTLAAAGFFGAAFFTTFLALGAAACGEKGGTGRARG